jgi:hypothetical protein
MTRHAPRRSQVPRRTHSGQESGRASSRGSNILTPLRAREAGPRVGWVCLDGCRRAWSGCEVARDRWWPNLTPGLPRQWHPEKERAAGPCGRRPSQTGRLHVWETKGFGTCPNDPVPTFPPEHPQHRAKRAISDWRNPFIGHARMTWVATRPSTARLIRTNRLPQPTALPSAPAPRVPPPGSRGTRRRALNAGVPRDRRNRPRSAAP